MSYNKNKKEYVGYVYLVTCEESGKQYVGLTTTTPHKRWLQHVNDTKSINRKTCKFHNAINKYGEDSFIVEIIKSVICKTEDELRQSLIELEKKYIKKYNTYENGYNATAGGEGYGLKYGEDNPFFGHTHSAESKQKIGESSRIRNAWLSTNTKEAKKKMVETKRKNGTQWFSDKARETAKIVNSTRKQTKEEIQKRLKTIADKRKVDPNFGKTDWAPELKQKMSKSRGGKSIDQFTIDGTLIRHWDGLYEIRDVLGYDSSSICKNCKGKIKTAYGYVWKYSNDNIEKIA